MNNTLPRHSDPDDFRLDPRPGGPVTDPIGFVITARCTPQTFDVIHRDGIRQLRAYLKAIGRCCGLKCVTIEELKR